MGELHDEIEGQPEKEWWEKEFAEQFRKSVYRDDMDELESFIRKVAAQSEKKGRDEREKEILAAIDATAYDEARAARSSEEGKTNNK